jgi:multidrug efflux pump subunit AcrA (membrane-fusion protein)
MMRRIVFLFGVSWLIASSWSAAAETVPVPHCLLSPVNEADVPAQEAGVIEKIAVRDGDAVTAGDLLAQIDATIPRAQQKVAESKLTAAETQAESDIDIRYATSARDVAKAEYDQGVEANEKVRNSVPRAEIRRRLLEWTKMDLSIEKARQDRAVAHCQVGVAKAELEAAKANVQRRRIVAPFDGVVVELAKHEGEWAENGATLLRIVHIKRLRVDGSVNGRQYRASDLNDRPVTVVATLPGGRRETFRGKIVYIKPEIKLDGDFDVRAEIENRQDNGVWALLPGMYVDMTIQLK